jgi:hypothetical protein
VLIGFLQNGDSAGSWGDDLFIPAIKARQALEVMTGHIFPYDVAASAAAWKKVERVKDFKERKRILSSLLPCNPNPLKAEVSGTGRQAFLKIRNVSDSTVTITHFPTYGSQTCPTSWSGFGVQGASPVKGRDDFVALQPDMIVQFPIELDDRFLQAEPASRKMTLVYDNNGSRFGVNAWIGVITVTFGSDWREERKVEAKTPNQAMQADGAAAPRPDR